MNQSTKFIQIGTMQGRLLPKYRGRYQAHPVDYWADEFPLAAQFGLNLIEFIVDYEDVHKNPLMSSKGISDLKNVMAANQVHVKSVCADYFMEAPLHSRNSVLASKSQEVFEALLHSLNKIGASILVLPCVDQSSLGSNEDKLLFIERLRPLLPKAQALGINISLETDLPPDPFRSLLETIDSKSVGVNYDTGNSASLGFNPEEELSKYGAFITDIHIKDRKLGGGSVALGTGNCNFELFFRSLRSLNYKGPFIMQAYRDDDGLAIFKSQFDWIKPKLAEFLS